MPGKVKVTDGGCDGLRFIVIRRNEAAAQDALHLMGKGLSWESVVALV